MDNTPVSRLGQGFSRWAFARALRHRGNALGLSHVARHVALAVAGRTHEDGLVRVHVAELREDTGVPKSTMWRALRELAAAGLLVVERGAVTGWGATHELVEAARASVPRRAPPRATAARETPTMQPDEAAAFRAVCAALSREKARRSGVAIVETCGAEAAARIGQHALAQAAQLGLSVDEYADRLVSAYLREQREIVVRARHPLGLLAQDIQLSTLAERVSRRARAEPSTLPAAPAAPIAAPAASASSAAAMAEGARRLLATVGGGGR